MIEVIDKRPLKRGERLPEDGCLVELDARLTLAGITCEREDDGERLGVGGARRWHQGIKRPVRVWFDDADGWFANHHPIETYSEIVSLLRRKA